MTKYDSTKWQYLLRLHISSSVVLLGPKLETLVVPIPQPPLFASHEPPPPSWTLSGWRPHYMSPCTTCLASTLPAGHGTLPHCHTQGPGHFLKATGVHQLLRLLLLDVKHEFLLAMESCTFMVMTYDLLHASSAIHWGTHTHHHLTNLLSRQPFLFWQEIPLLFCPSLFSQDDSIIVGEMSLRTASVPICLSRLSCDDITISHLYPVCIWLGTAGIWLSLIFLSLHPHTVGCAGTQVRRSCGQGRKHM